MNGDATGWDLGDECEIVGIRLNSQPSLRVEGGK
jgi:hypothetical protein